MSECKCKFVSIDAVLSGQRLRNIIIKSGYSVEELQEMLCMSCPQTIYRWFWGKSIPSTDNLYAMSKLFGMHMEDMLVEQPKNVKPAKYSYEEENQLYDEKMCIKKQIAKMIDAQMYTLLDGKDIDIEFLSKLCAVLKKTRKMYW